MKNLLLGSLALAFMASCNAPTGPEKVATDYLTSLMEKNWDKARELGTAETKTVLDFITQNQGDYGITEVKDVKCEITDNTAECTFCCSSYDKKSITLVKENDKWLVSEKWEEPEADEEVVVEADSIMDSLSQQVDKVTE
jgi:hypothetical protein